MAMKAVSALALVAAVATSVDAQTTLYGSVDIPNYWADALTTRFAKTPSCASIAASVDLSPVTTGSVVMFKTTASKADADKCLADGKYTHKYYTGDDETKAAACWNNKTFLIGANELCPQEPGATCGAGTECFKGRQCTDGKCPYESVPGSDKKLAKIQLTQLGVGTEAQSLAFLDYAILWIPDATYSSNCNVNYSYNNINYVESYLLDNKNLLVWAGIFDNPDKCISEVQSRLPEIVSGYKSSDPAVDSTFDVKLEGQGVKFQSECFNQNGSLVDNNSECLKNNSYTIASLAVSMAVAIAGIAFM